MKSKKILVLIIIALIVALFVNMMIIKSKTLSFSKIENEKEIVTEINNTDDEEKEDNLALCWRIAAGTAVWYMCQRQY